MNNAPDCNECKNKDLLEWMERNITSNHESHGKAEKTIHTRINERLDKKTFFAIIGILITVLIPVLAIVFSTQSAQISKLEGRIETIDGKLAQELKEITKAVTVNGKTIIRIEGKVESLQEGFKRLESYN